MTVIGLAATALEYYPDDSRMTQLLSIEDSYLQLLEVTGLLGNDMLLALGTVLV
mgnify:CR=1 FL=1